MRLVEVVLAEKLKYGMVRIIRQRDYKWMRNNVAAMLNRCAKSFFFLFCFSFQPLNVNVSWGSDAEKHWYGVKEQEVEISTYSLHSHLRQGHPMTVPSAHTHIYNVYIASTVFMRCNKEQAENNNTKTNETKLK